MPPWNDLRIPIVTSVSPRCNAAIDEQRARRKLTWKSVAHEVNRAHERLDRHPIGPATISGLKNRRWGVGGDGVLHMLIWLDRTPESFVPGPPGAAHPDALLPRPGGQQILRFDVPRIYSKLEGLRVNRGLTWMEVGR